ncbi:MAG: hypothetical protein MJ077_05910 [Oscillospiraceae bacterium]|nr:hypothetical protein [Oscillospiraceae bacterium]
MATTADTIPTKQKNSCAIRLMRTMLLKYAEREAISFDEAMLRFAESSAYELLFDFDTEVWREGPDYLMMLFEEALNEHE